MYPGARKYPDTWYVNENPWSLKFVKRIPGQPQSDLGNCDPSDSTMRIRLKQTRREYFQTFMHEVLHAIEFEYDMKIPHNVVHDLEEPLARFIEENFELLALLFRP